MHNELDFELSYWDTAVYCDFDECQKQQVYAAYMQIPINHYKFDVSGKRILDMGGGPVSMLLKCENLSRGLVIDPLIHRFPAWVRERYSSRGIDYESMRGEDFVYEGEWGLTTPARFDEAWIYNCLQHTDDPEKIIRNAMDWAPVLRIFEWINIPPHEGHPVELTQAKLDEWTNSRGRITQLGGQGCYGTAYYNVVSDPLLSSD